LSQLALADLDSSVRVTSSSIRSSLLLRGLRVVRPLLQFRALFGGNPNSLGGLADAIWVLSMAPRFGSSAYFLLRILD